MTKQKGGSWLGALEIGTAVYAAKTSGTFRTFLMKFATYAIIISVAVVVIGFVLGSLGIIKREHFIPTAPSSEGDKKAVTPAGNVILY
jgi:putative copper export protein